MSPPSVRAMTRAERSQERRFVWRVLFVAVGLQVMGGAVAITMTCRCPPARPGHTTPVARSMPSRFDPQQPLR